MGFDDLMMKHEGNEMKIKQPFEIVKHPNIKRRKAVSIKIKAMECKNHDKAISTQT